MREFADEAEDRISAVRREVELLRREFTVLREEVGLERGLKDLRRDVVKAQRQIPKLPAIAARLHAEAHIAKGCVEAELQRELEATKRTVTILGAQQSCFNFNLERTLTGSQTSEVEYQTSEERMIIRHHMHPELPGRCVSSRHGLSMFR
jgi:hypothetical protein